MKELSIERVLSDEFIFPEGPRWHDGRLYVSDMQGARVAAISESGDVETIVRVPESPSGLGWLPDGRMVIVSMHDFKLLRLEGGELTPHADLSGAIEYSANDMVVDAQGRAYVGNFGFDPFDQTEGNHPLPTSLVMAEPDGSVRVVADDVLFPNGMVITPDGRHLYVAETYGYRLTAFDIAADGSLSGRRVFADLGARTPDGIALDAEGAVWVACFAQNEFVRVHEGGEISARISSGERSALACALGGDDRRSLFLLSVADIDKSQQGKSQGFVEMLRVDTPGAGIP